MQWQAMGHIRCSWWKNLPLQKYTVYLGDFHSFQPKKENQDKAVGAVCDLCSTQCVCVSVHTYTLTYTYILCVSVSMCTCLVGFHLQPHKILDLGMCSGRALPLSGSWVQSDKHNKDLNNPVSTWLIKEEEENMRHLPNFQNTD